MAYSSQKQLYKLDHKVASLLEFWEKLFPPRIVRQTNSWVWKQSKVPPTPSQSGSALEQLAPQEMDTLSHEGWQMCSCKVR